MSEYPLLATADVAQAIEALLRHRIVGGQGISVRQTRDVTTISLARVQARDEGGGVAGLPRLTVMRLRLDGGSPGDESNPCTFAYSLYEYSDGYMQNPIATGKQALFGRTARGKYEAAPDGAPGLVAVLPGVQGQIEYGLLLACGERPETALCDP